jgi:hypothetical protein
MGDRMAFMSYKSSKTVAAETVSLSLQLAPDALHLSTSFTLLYSPAKVSLNVSVTSQVYQFLHGALYGGIWGLVS